MNLYLLMARHGYALTFGLLLAEAIGLPFPAAIALVAAGAAVAAHALWGPYILLAAIVALLLGDTVQFWLGRYMGWLLLGFLCRVSINPETCILRSAESFYKRGKATLVIAKFIPGVNTMAAPLAGSMKMRFWQFLQSGLCRSPAVLPHLSVGGISFPRFSGRHPERISCGRACHGSGRDHRSSWPTRFTASHSFPGTRIIAWCRGCRCRSWPRVWPPKTRDRVLIVDVRSHGYYDSGAERIEGSIRIEPNNLEEEIKNLPKDKDIYLYCT